MTAISATSNLTGAGNRLPQLGNRGAFLIQMMRDKLIEHKQYIREFGVDLPEVRNWKWTQG